MIAEPVVLIVDDDRATRDTLSALLFAQHWNLVFATNGNEALDTASRMKPDVVLLDVMMPGMNGFEVCRRLRADPVLGEVPVLLITALDDAGSRLQGIEAGADDFITKPFDRIELRARIRATLKVNRYRRLMNERAKFEWVVEQAQDGYLLLDETDHILYANPCARRYLNLVAETGDSARESFMAVAEREYRCHAAEDGAAGSGARQTGQTYPRYLVRPASELAPALWLEVEVLAIPGDPSASRMIRLRDVSRQVSTQRAVWAFESMVSHKLNTPLTWLLTGLELFGSALNLADDALLAELFSATQRGARRLQDEIEDILRYISLSYGAVAGGSLAIGELEAVIARLENNLVIPPVELSVPNELTDFHVPLSMRATELILQELLENAQKFHPDHLPQVELRVFRRGPQEIAVQVLDDGKSLSQEQLERLWMPYYQAEASFTGQVTGMGLGLAMVASMVWEAGGRCEARNRPDKPGLVVELVLPLCRRAELCEDFKGYRWPDYLS